MALLMLVYTLPHRGTMIMTAATCSPGVERAPVQRDHKWRDVYKTVVNRLSQNKLFVNLNLVRYLSTNTNYSSAGPAWKWYFAITRQAHPPNLKLSFLRACQCLSRPAHILCHSLFFQVRAFAAHMCEINLKQRHSKTTRLNKPRDQIVCINCKRNK